MNHLAKSRWFIWQMVHFKSRWFIFRPYNRDTTYLQNLTNYHGITSHYQVLFKQHCWLQKLFSGIFSYDVIIPQDGWKRPRPRQLVRSRPASLSLQSSNGCLFNLQMLVSTIFINDEDLDYSWQQATGYNPQFSNFKKFQNQPPEFQPPPIKFGQVSVFRW